MDATMTDLTATGHLPVFDAAGNGISVIEYRGANLFRSHAVYVVADDRIERRNRRNYVPEHRATPAHLVDSLDEAERWSHRRHAILTD